MNPKELFEEQINKGAISRDLGLLALEYIAEEQRLRNWKKGTVHRHYQSLKPFLELLTKENISLPQLNRSGVLELIGFLQEHPAWSEDTKPSNWVNFCLFYKWAYKKAGKKWDSEAAELLIGEDKYIYKRDKNRITQKDTFTPEQILELVAAEAHLPYKAFFGVTYETGMRVGEALSLLIKDISRSEYGYFIDIRASKTEKRRVIVENYFVAVLNRWLKAHPARENPNSKLFLNLSSKELTQFAANKRLKELSSKLFPEKKKVSVHSLRHSRATELAEIYTEAQMCKFFGWANGSRMTAVYVRKAAVDIVTAQRRALGKTAVTVKEAGKKCLMCANINPSEVEYCEVCSMPLDARKLPAINGSTERLIDMLNAMREQITLDAMARLRGEQGAH